MIAMSIALGVLAGLLLWPYLGYPIFISLIPRRTAILPSVDAQPSVSVLIPAHNEAAHISAKLKNTQMLVYGGLCEVIVCSDGSTDGTDALITPFKDVRLIRNETRSGKASSLNRLVAEATGELILFTDASAVLMRDTLNQLVATMADPSVGVACARYVVRPADETNAEAEAGYWGLEGSLRAREAERDLLVGASGAAYMIRRALIPTLPADTVNDDWTVPLTVRRAGHRIAFVPQAVASDEPTNASSSLSSRWVRIAYGNYQMLWRHRGAFLQGRLFWPLMRKLLRTMGPLLIGAALILLAFGAGWYPEFFIPAVLAWSLAAGGLIAVLIPERSSIGQLRVVRFARFATLAQLAYARGAFRFLLQRRTGLWQRPSEPDMSQPAQLPLSVRFVKRSFDVISASVALLLLAPVMLVVAIAIRLDSKGAVIYRQTRLCPGSNGRPHEFVMYKFRSMAVNAEANGPVWAQKNDARVTRIGRFIRKHRIDEFPQFFNILLGHMSLVGPRPERQFYVEKLTAEVPGYNDRHMVLRPGLTGWAQVNCEYGDSVEAAREKLAHDLVYIAHLYRLTDYLKMEGSVIIRTFRVVLTGKGAR